MNLEPLKKKLPVLNFGTKSLVIVEGQNEVDALRTRLCEAALQSAYIALAPDDEDSDKQA